MARAFVHKQIDYLLDFMELSAKRKARIRELSGGMQRRLIIARALLNNPELLILDEPTTGLDPQVRQVIWKKLRNLKQRGVTILLTTHYMDEAFQLADNVIIMDNAKTVLEGKPRALLAEHIEQNVLQQMTGRLDPHDYLLRPVNLEDLFIKATGRSLNELQ